MRAYGVDKATLIAIGDELGLIVNFGTEYEGSFNFSLKWQPRLEKDDCTYRHKSISWQGERWTRSVCYHGHYDFLYEVFVMVPEARVTSGWYGKVDYRGMRSFQEQARELATVQIGAPIMGGFPTTIESCDCGAFGYGIKHDIDIQEVRDGIG